MIITPINIETIILLIILLFSVYVLINVFPSGKSPNREQKKYFFVLNLFVVLWVISILVTELFYTNINIALWSSRISFTTSLLISYWYYKFVLSYSKNKQSFINIINNLLFVIVLVFTVLSLTQGIVKEVFIKENELHSITGNAYLAYGILVALMFVVSGFVFYRFYKKEKNSILKTQMFYILVGSITSIVMSFLSNFIIPLLTGLEIRFLGPLGLVFFIFSTYYAILRYRFLSTKLLLKKFLYTFFIAFVPYLIFHLIVLLQNITWGGVYEIGALISGYVYSVLFVYLFVFASKNIENFVKRAFSKNAVDRQKEKQIFVESIDSTLKISLIFNKTIMLLEKIFDTKVSIIFLKNKNINYNLSIINHEKIDDTKKDFLNSINKMLIKDELGYLEKDEILFNFLDFIDSQIIIPARISNNDNKDIILIIGNKKLYESYSIEDIEYIKSIISVIKVALQRSLLYQQMDDFNQTLQQKVDLQTKELQIKVSELQEARRKEADMIDIMGHELRTPATIVKLNAQLLDKFTNKVTEDPKSFKKYLDRIKIAVENEIKLINTLLSSAKLEGDKIEINAEKVDIKNEIEMALHGHENEAKDKNLELINNTKPETPYVYADKARTIEILNNLISNAVKYTETGSVTVKTENSEDFVKISVIDTGKGISKEDIPKLGRKFYRATNYIESEDSDNFDIVRPGGTGLGLYVAFSLIKKMGGDIYVESDLGKGSKFIFTLPKYSNQDEGNSKEQSNDMFERLGLKK